MIGPKRVVLRCSIVLSTVALASAAPAAWAQSAPSGDWQGELEGTSLTLVLHINKNGPSSLDSPNQGAYGLKADLISKDSTVDFTVPSIGATFHGVLRGTTIAGTFSQNGNELPLALTSTKGGSVKPAATAPNAGPPIPGNLAGTWQGRLERADLPLVLHIDPAGVSTLDSPQQSAFGLRANVIVIGDSVRFTIPAVRAGFNGTVKGSVIEGEFSQNGMTLPLTLKRTGG
jgi:hypothetical protein